MSHESQLQSALLSAFPTRSALTMMVRLGMHENLAAIAGDSDLTTVVFNLIVWATARGRLKELVEQAHAENPDNPELKDFAAGFLSAPAPPSDGKKGTSPVNITPDMLRQKLDAMHEVDVDALINAFLERRPWKAIRRSPLGDKINDFVAWAQHEKVLEEAYAWQAAPSP